MSKKYPHLVLDEEQLDKMPFEKVRKTIYRAGRGPDGLGEFQKALLCDMNDGWVKASIDYVDKDHPHRKYYIQELNYRKLLKRKETINKINDSTDNI